MRPNLPDKLYYSISEVAKSFDVNTSLIRFWEKEFPIIKPQKNKNGNRVFTKKDIDIFKNIYYLVKIKGFTLDGAKQIIEKQGIKNVIEEIDVIQRLENLKNELITIKQQLDETEY